MTCIQLTATLLIGFTVSLTQLLRTLPTLLQDKVEKTGIVRLITQFATLYSMVGLDQAMSFGA